MAYVVFLRGVNIGGHRVLRPSTVPGRLPEFRLRNIGAAGTFIVLQRTSQAALRQALAKVLPFRTDILICSAAAVRDFMAANPFAGVPRGPDTVRFVSVLSRSPQTRPVLPMEFRDGRRWLVRLLAQRGRFVAGIYRREMKTISYLGRIDRVFEVPLTTRQWSTFSLIADALEAARRRGA